jgi:phospholipase/lecithinase/hemolysin
VASAASLIAYLPDCSGHASIASETQGNFVSIRGIIMGIRTIFTVVIFLTTPTIFNAQAVVYSQVIVFGDSLSDDGNVAHRVRDTVGFSYPSSNFNYSDYRFTDDTNTSPAANLYVGTWHEQLEKTFLSLPLAKNSLDGGTDYAFGGATTKNGTQERTLEDNPFPFAGGSLAVTIDNMGKQVDDYLATHPADPNALYVVWGGGNDLFDNHSAQSVVDTANRVGGLITRLANAGARNFLVPNVPPLGAVPNSLGDPTRVAELDFASFSYRAWLYSIINSVTNGFAQRGITIHVYNLDVWLDLIRFLGQPANYNFVNTTDPAQGASGVNPDQYLFWDDIHPTTAGHHQLANEANRLLSGQIPPLARATNIGTRGSVGTGQNVLIAGFMIAGNHPKKIVVRALGPSLANFGVTGALADPTIALFNSSNVVVASNDNWRDTQQAELAASGYAPPSDLDSAIIVTLAPGSYTAVASGKNSATGIALVDLYEADNSPSIFQNLSTRGFVGSGDNVLIGGLVIGTGEPAVIVVRAVGPTLASAGITQPLQDPTLELRDANGALISFDDNWKANTPTAVKAALLPLTDDREAAIVASLAAGNYTAIIRGKNGTTGVALVEAYRLR